MFIPQCALRILGRLPVANDLRFAGILPSDKNSGALISRPSTEALSKLRRRRGDEAQTRWNLETPHVVSYGFPIGSTLGSISLASARIARSHSSSKTRKRHGSVAFSSQIV
jgi:hypothetical protein